MYEGDFIAGINTPLGVATYHIKLDYWDMFNVIELEEALEYEGYNSEENIMRLFSLNDNLIKKRL